MLHAIAAVTLLSGWLHTWMSSISPVMDPRQYPMRAPFAMNSSSSAL